MSVAVITGAASGIGAATARLLAGSGIEVVAVDRDAEALAHLDADVGIRQAAVVDVGDAPAMHELAASVGPVDLLVNNAGVGVAGPFAGTEQDWEWLWSVNADGVLNGCRAFGEPMLERGAGHIVNVASGMAWVPNRRMAAYCTSKAAVLMLSRCLRAEWRPRGVGVSVVCPGVIDTPILETARVTSVGSGLLDKATFAFRHAHSPDTVARAIERAWRQNRGVMPVGAEAHLARLTPGPVLDLLARL